MDNNANTLLPYSLDSAAEAVEARIKRKINNYSEYKFTSPQSCAINIFFDLSQEFDEVKQLHLLTVLLLGTFFNYQSELYLRDDSGKLERVTPLVGTDADFIPIILPEVWGDEKRWFIPIRGKNALIVTSDHRIVADEDLIGVLVVYKHQLLNPHDLLFLEKFANRVGFCLHTKELAQRNSRHIIFVRKLVHDIGHNIITPNMRIKLQLSLLENQLAAFGELCNNPADETTLQDMRIMHRKMEEQAKTIMGSFKNSALFLETLLRQSHFDLGHYVLRSVRLDICAYVIKPQFERYRPHFEEKGLHITPEQPILDPPHCMVMADLGLISQVLANFLSNAAKYCKSLKDGSPGEVRCTTAVVPAAFNGGTDGLKVSVFSSGKHIPPDEAAQLFDDNYRASNSSGQYGTGHGLYFVREIIAEHKGVTGYDAVEGGNSFYFMLPITE